MNVKIATKIILTGVLIVAVAYWLRGHDLLTGLAVLVLFLIVIAKVVCAIVSRRGGSSSGSGGPGSAGRPVPRRPVGRPPALKEAHEVTR